MQAFQHLPFFVRNSLWKAADGALNSNWKYMRHLDVFRRAASGQLAFWGSAEAYQETIKQRFLSQSFLGKLKGYTSYEPVQALYRDFKADAPEGADNLHWMSYIDLRFRLPELLLMRVDKMTMATSVEARVPFLDQEFVNMSMGIPQTLKFKDKTLKYILKKAVEPLLPHDIIYRKKQGFGVPVESWFQDKLKTWADNKILDFVKRTDYFDPRVMPDYIQGVGSKMSWFLLNFVLWHEIWIEGRSLDELPT
jgi:asparagine synthase (glutamine-hydrolysing)